MKSNALKYLILICLFIAAFGLNISLGSVSLPFSEVISELINFFKHGDSGIVITLRIPRSMTAILAGFSLSIAGMQMQTIFRNPLAGPFVLGISSGASLGVAILMLGLSAGFIAQYQLLGNWMIVCAAIVGSISILMVILTITKRMKEHATILIIGLMFSSASSALVNILQYFSNEVMLKAFIVWSMGSLSHVNNDQLLLIVPIVVLGLLLSFLSIKPLNLFMLGHETALSLGLNIRKWRLIVFMSTGILGGAITAFCGPIGFIGIAVPHLSKMLFQTAKHNILFWANLLIGGSIMLLGDLLSRLPGSDLVLPINSITALIGIPIVIWVVAKRRKVIT